VKHWGQLFFGTQIIKKTWRKRL